MLCFYIVKCIVMSVLGFMPVDPNPVKTKPY